MKVTDELNELKKEYGEFFSKFEELGDNELENISGGEGSYESDPRYQALMAEFTRLNRMLKDVGDPAMAALLIQSMEKTLREMARIREEYKE